MVDTHHLQGWLLVIVLDSHGQVDAVLQLHDSILERYDKELKGNIPGFWRLLARSGTELYYSSTPFLTLASDPSDFVFHSCVALQLRGTVVENNGTKQKGNVQGVQRLQSLSETGIPGLSRFLPTLFVNNHNLLLFTAY